MQTNGENNCFISLKDHKESFQNNLTVRLISPAKNELGKISKVILGQINKNIWENLQLNQWKTTSTFIDFFIAIQDKHLHSFVIFDIKEFCPKIINKSTKVCRTICSSDENKRVINHSRKSLLFNNQQLKKWIIRRNYITIGAYHGAEVCKFVVSFLLHQLSNKCNKKDIGLYRDDGLAAFKNKIVPQAERIKKDFQNIFQEND